MEEVEIFLQAKLNSLMQPEQLIRYLSFSSEVLLLFTRTVRMMATMIRKIKTLRILMVMTVLVLTSFFSRQGMSPS